jgi:hypothetical protein
MKYHPTQHALLAVLSTFALVAGAGLTAALPASADDRGARVHLVAKLRGSTEVPGPGDRNGRGRAEIVLHRAQGMVCARVHYRNIGQPIGAHIHRGRAGVAGDVVVDLTPSVTSNRNCASDVGRALIRRIAQHPKRFYFNVHTNRFPEGAIRGQLHR